MPAEAIHMSAMGLDLSPRVVQSSSVVASPAAATETIICTITIPTNAATALGVQLFGWAAYLLGANGVSSNLRIRQTNTSGTAIAASGVILGTAADLISRSVQGLDTAAALPGQVYVLTLVVTSGTAASTVSACQLVAVVV